MTTAKTTMEFLGGFSRLRDLLKARADLAHVVGMGVSTPHHDFRMLTSMSPVQCQKQLRFHTSANFSAPSR